MTAPDFRPARPAGIVAVVVLVHVAFVIGLLATKPAVLRPQQRNVLEVAVIEPARPERPPPPQAPTPPKKFQPPMPVVTPPVTPAPVQPTIVEPLVPLVSLPEPEAIRLSVAEPDAAVRATPPVVAGTSVAEAPFTPPNFNASYLDNPRPVYPPVARRTRLEGRVLLAVDVSAEGRALNVEIAQSSGQETLDQAALKAVRLWRFVPARRAGVPVAASVKVPVSFALDT